ncbi:GDP-L-fucose synthase family protein [Methylibium sp.]|uniref:GDP-L-fucose synthase family protein n=1 Tax=Methylibium sp. TaxID=2067992 RepID=UPI00345C0EDE
MAGHNGLVGRSLVRRLRTLGHDNLLLRSRSELNLSDQAAVQAFLSSHPISQIYVAAAKVGGILANSTLPADFIHENLLIQSNLIAGAHAAGIQQLLFLGSSCIYPKLAAQPIVEEALLTGPLEPTNEPYAIAKIAGIKLCEGFARQYGRDYRTVMPTNLYGPHDNFHPSGSHVLPALIRRFVEAVEQNAPVVTVWGSGTPRREFLHVDDLAAACVTVMNVGAERLGSITTETCSHVNIGCGEDHTIADVAHLVARLTGYRGAIEFDTSKPDGTPRKLLDCSKVFSLDWKPALSLEQGLRQTIDWYLANRASAA